MDKHRQTRRSSIDAAVSALARVYPRPLSVLAGHWLDAVAADGYARFRNIAALDQLIADLLHRFLAQVADREQGLLVHLQHLPDLSDVGALEAVVGTSREIQLLNRCVVNVGRDDQAMRRCRR